MFNEITIRKKQVITYYQLTVSLTFLPLHEPLKYGDTLLSVKDSLRKNLFDYSLFFYSSKQDNSYFKYSSAYSLKLLYIFSDLIMNSSYRIKRKCYRFSFYIKNYYV